jgi:hypothetical protein
MNHPAFRFPRKYPAADSRVSLRLDTPNATANTTTKYARTTSQSMLVNMNHPFPFFIFSR